MSIYEFWRSTGWCSRIGVVIALIAIVMNGATYLHVFREDSFTIYLPHLAIIVLGAAVVLRLRYHHYLAFRNPTVPVRASSPRVLWIAGGVALLYFVIVAATAPNNPDDPNIIVRVFSAAWAFFAILIAGADDVIGQRIDAFRGRTR